MHLYAYILFYLHNIIHNVVMGHNIPISQIISMYTLMQYIQSNTVR